MESMACIVYRKDDGGRVYAYSSESYWCKEKHQPRSRRTYLGRVNPETGEIIKGRQNGKNYKPQSSSSKTDDASDKEKQRLVQELSSKNTELMELRQEIQVLQRQVDRMSHAFQTIVQTASKATS